MLKTLSLVAFAALAAVCCGVSADSLFKRPIELPSHRLPTNVKPLHYDIYLDLTSGPEHAYKGRVNITLEFGVGSKNRVLEGLLRSISRNTVQVEPSSPLKEPANQIIMHADESLTISSIKVYKLTDKWGRKPVELTIVNTGHDSVKQLIALTVDGELTNGGTKGLVVIEFEGRLRTDMRGIYTSSNETVPGKRAQIVAKFEPTYARLALPCFDEPAFKASFAITLTHLKSLKAFATMANTYKRDEFGGPVRQDSKNVKSYFETTLPMSIHTLAFIVGAFSQMPRYPPEVLEGTQIRVITPPGRSEAGAFALKIAQESLKWFETYIGSKIPLDKLDLVAISHTNTDITPTWGLAFVRDNHLLVDDATEPDTKIVVALSVARVVAHQWLGNLITVEWWSDLWITESIAAHMAFEFVASKYARDESDFFVRTLALSSVVQSDSLGRKHSLSPPEEELTTSSQVSELFDNIQFMKAAALAHLMQEALGHNNFWKSLRSFSSNNAYGNVRFDNLVKALRGSSSWKSEYEEILRSWTTLKSFPLINAVLDEPERHLVLYQEPYPTARKEILPSSEISSLNSEPPVSNAWTLPVKVLFAQKCGGQQTKIVSATLGPGNSQVKIELPKWFVTGEHWLKVSPFPTLSAYYRVRYSGRLLGQLERAVVQKLMSAKDRLHLLDDANALVSSGLIKNDTFKGVLGWYANEDDYAVIIGMLSATRTLATLKVFDATPSASSQVFMKLYETHGFNVSGSETMLEQRAREVTLNELVARGVQQVIQDGLRVFGESKKGKIALFLREPVYAAVVAGGTEEQVELLRANLRKTTSLEEKERLTRALTLSKDVSSLNGLNS